MTEVSSIYVVTDYKTGKQYEEEVHGYGQEAIRFLRGEYPKFSKFVLESFEVDGKRVELNLKTQNRC